MAKRISESPTIADQLIFDIQTPNSSGCVSDDPYMIDSVNIYYIHRDFALGNTSLIKREHFNLELQEKLNAAKLLACDDPSEENLNSVSDLESQLEATKTIDEIQFNEAKVIASFGSPDYPAWLSTDEDNAILTHVDAGKFELEWTPLGMREGDYFICWTWTPYPSGDKLSAHDFFSLNGSTQLTTSIPTHYTNPTKYEILQERYLPEMFKLFLAEKDLSPYVIQELNKSVAKGFTFLEDMANQIVDLIDANATHESLLDLMSNLFNLKLKSNDPTLWRRQIKRAVPLFKKKGTLGGIEEALSQAGVKLIKFTRLWQVISQYVWQECFEYVDTNEFTLSKLAITPTDDNYKLYLRTNNTWEEVDISLVDISELDGVTTINWLGDDLEDGNAIRIIYKIKEIPGESEQEVEDYISSLPLMDTRNEYDQEFPLKNWNVRVIEEDDPMIDVVIQSRTPYYDDVIFGKVRTEFGYSENIYNMDEYNGSKRDSVNPCDIDSNFIDNCSGSLSSCFVADVKIENLSDDRILETKEIFSEYMPFHAVLHSLNIIGAINDFVKPPIESITSLVRCDKQDFTVADPPQTIFSRTMKPSSQYTREMLATTEEVASDSGTAKNDHIVLFSPEIYLNSVPVDIESLTRLEILSPSANSGIYTIEQITKNYAVINSVLEPVDEAAFTFKLSNERVRKASSTIYQSNKTVLSDSIINFSDFELKTQWDVDNDYADYSWKILIGSTTVDILQILPNNTLIIESDDDIDTGDVDYSLLDENLNVIYEGSGSISIANIGKVDISGTLLVRGNSTSLTNIKDYVKIGYYALIDGVEYKVLGFPSEETHQFYIENYTDGDQSGIEVVVLQRLINNKTGYLHYKGLILETTTDYESSLEILNGTNSPSEEEVLENDQFKENYLILIGTDYYTIAEIDGTSITLNGPYNEWTLAGTSVGFTIIKFSKFTNTTDDPPVGMRFDPVADIPERTYPPVAGHKFEFLDRRGNEVYSISTATASMNMAAFSAELNSNNPIDSIIQSESIKFEIERR